jgi:choline kinase
MSAWPAGGSFDPNRVRDDMLDMEVQNIMRHARLWRVANSAQWVAWGIVQAKIPAMEKELAAGESPASIDKDTVRATESTRQREQGSESETDTEMGAETETETEIVAAQEQQEQVEEFDYLAYAHDRVLFFWADLLSLGVIQESDLPEQILDIAKSRIINY